MPSCSLRMWLNKALLLLFFVQSVHCWSWPQLQLPLVPSPPSDSTSHPESTTVPADPRIIGIHLGPDLIRAAVSRNNIVSLIPFENGILSMPSIVSYNSDPPLIGHAVTDTDVESLSTIRGIERILGRKWTDPTVQSVLADGSLPIVQEADGTVILEVEKVVAGKRDIVKMKPEAVMAELLAKIKSAAEEYLGEEVQQAVCVVPFEWRSEIAEPLNGAGRQADLEIVRLMTEPIAAALGAGYEDVFYREETYMLVYNVGEHNTSATALMVEEGVFEIVSDASVAHTQLGITKADEATRFAAAMPLVNEVLTQAKLTKDQIDNVLLVGEAGAGAHLLLSQHFRTPLGDVPPEIVVVHGGAIKGAIFQSETWTGCTMTVAVNVLTLGVETVGGLLWPIIKRGTSIPTMKSHIFTTATDNQTSMLISVFEGEFQQTNRTELRGTFEITDIVPAPKGTEQVEVVFQLDYHEPPGLKVTTRYRDNETTVDLGRSPFTWQEADLRIEGGNLYGEDGENEDWESWAEGAVYWKDDDRVGEIAAQPYDKGMVGTMEPMRHE